MRPQYSDDHAATAPLPLPPECRRIHANGLYLCKCRVQGAWRLKYARQLNPGLNLSWNRLNHQYLRAAQLLPPPPILFPQFSKYTPPILPLPISIIYL